ncbi:unnamed protein product [Phyllotreta striolata]|uniref:Cytochrome P450 n=1 Tax=Phyllotreta striolata TaxID=444603 RepID=A0A9N9TLE7_PHYSR|nr:unnamed protein product [Phyllotreta striolata]
MWLLVALVLVLLYYLIRRHYSYWKNLGVPGPKPWPLFGNYADNFFGKRTARQIATEIYRDYEGYPFVGIYKATTPALMIRDPELLRNILVKDFKHFTDNDFEVDKEIDPVFGRNPFVLKGQEWKHKRAQLTPCFTSGKMKGMYIFLDTNAQRMIRYIEEETKMSTSMEARELCIRFTLDNVAACAFGLEGKCFDETNPEFRILAHKLISPEGLGKITSLIMILCPWVASFLKIKLVDKDTEQRLIDIVSSTLKYRKENKVVRNDFLDVMTEISTENGLFSEIDVVANSASFFGDGYETSSRVMSFVLFEIAQNSGAQGRLREEINEVLSKNGNKFTYEVISNMPYLEACLNETLRKISIIDLVKICTEDYTYESTAPGFKPLKINIKAGTSILLPVDGLHRDPVYFPDPDKFLPERFLDKQDEGFKKHLYIPFGDGPRICLGQRFGILQIKVGVAYIIKHYQLSVNSKTQLPLKFNPYYMMPDAIGGLWIDITKVN